MEDDFTEDTDDILEQQITEEKIQEKQTESRNKLMQFAFKKVLPPTTDTTNQ